MGTFNCSSKERGKNTVIVEKKVPSTAADCEVTITEEAANVTEVGFSCSWTRLDLTSPSLLAALFHMCCFSEYVNFMLS